MVMTRQIGEFERWASGIASTAMGSWGMRRGGLLGIVALAGAGFLAWRAGTGQSLMPESGQKLLDKAMSGMKKDEPAPRKAATRTRRAPAKTAKTGTRAATTTAAKRRTAAASASADTAKTPGKAMKKPASTRRKAAAPRAPRANSGAEAMATKSIN